MSSSAREFIKNLIPRRFLIRQLRQQAILSRSVLLTLDDGPDISTTPRVLDLLDRYSAKAIFFVVGRRISKAPQILPEILRRGHGLGNHTFVHNHHCPPPFRAYLADVARCQKTIFSLTGVRPQYFRPPSGHLSPVSLSVPILLNLRLMNWSLNVRDWKCHTSQDASNASKAILNRVRPGDIILLHDDNPRLVEILEAILPELTARQYDLAQGIHSI